MPRRIHGRTRHHLRGTDSSVPVFRQPSGARHQAPAARSRRQRRTRWHAGCDWRSVEGPHGTPRDARSVSGRDASRATARPDRDGEDQPAVVAIGAATHARACRGSATNATTRTGFRSILCPIDFSDQSRLALRYAAAVARRSHGRLSILYVNDPLLIAAAGIALNDRGAGRDAISPNCAGSSNPPCHRGHGAGPVRRSGHDGKTGRRDHEAATRRRCDLIVMGTHGLTGADKLLFIGSTTQGVLQRTSVPVLAIPEETRSRLVPRRQVHRGRARIIAAVDARSTGQA